MGLLDNEAGWLLFVISRAVAAALSLSLITLV